MLLIIDIKKAYFFIKINLVTNSTLSNQVVYIIFLHSTQINNKIEISNAILKKIITP